MSTIFKLIIEDDEGKTTVFPLVDVEVSIGRKEGNTIRLMERNVSRRHARLVREDEAVYVEDLDSYNGVRINGERIASRLQVREGDLIEIGDYHLALQRAEAAVVETVTEGAPQREANRSRDGSTWPAGTVPDFRLPEDLIDAPAPVGAVSQPSSRDTVIDPPTPDFSAAVAAQNSVASTGMGETLTEGTTDRLEEPVLRSADQEVQELPPFPSNGPSEPDAVLTSTNRPSEVSVGESAGEAAHRARTAGPALRAEVPRLVCVSTQYAGQEFSLQQEELVIGRVEDNDIVIEHRSVSRNHAKVRFDGRTHRIIDLQSANGILVNGEEYAMTNLRAGDLIELGNVRFRFVPAGEVFEANAEEAREMRSNGIEPPTTGQTAEPATPAIPAYDPSQAATITDAPRSALPAAHAPLVSSARSDPGGGLEPPEPSDGSYDDRITTRLEPPQGSAPSAASLAGMSTEADFAEAESIDERPRESSYRGMMLGLIAVLAVLVVVLLYLVGQGDSAHDQKLQELYNQGNYAEVKVYFEAHQSEFADPAKAGILVGRAEARLERPELDNSGLRARVSPGTETKVPPAPEPERLEAPAPDTAEVPDPDPTEKSESSPRRRRSASAASRGAKLSAQRMSQLGRRALIAGDMAEAERTLEKCIRRFPDFPPCHRSLGVLYGQLDEPARSVSHYERYLELAPDAADADRVREMIRSVKSGEQP